MRFERESRSRRLVVTTAMLAVGGILLMLARAGHQSSRDEVTDTPEACVGRYLAAEEEAKPSTERQMGWATSQFAMTGSDKASLVLERIYQDHVGRQSMALVRVGGRWQIREVSEVDRQSPLIPYGTPVDRVDPVDTSQSRASSK